jgi:hypothetical protein
MVFTPLHRALGIEPPPLRQRLEGKRFLPAWGDFTRNEKIGIVSAGLTGLGIVAAVAIATVSAA